MAGPPDLVLVLEDEALIALDIETSLSDYNIPVLTFSSSAAALTWLETATPAAAILDIGVADGSSAAVVDLLTRRYVPFIVYSGDTQNHFVGTAFNDGRWLNKPASTKDLLAAVNAVLGATKHTEL